MAEKILSPAQLARLERFNKIRQRIQELEAAGTKRKTAVLTVVKEFKASTATVYLALKQHVGTD